MFLLSAVILARTCDMQTQHVAIKLQTRFGIADHNRGMVNAEKQTILSLPFRITLPFGKLQDFQPVFIRIAKVESFDTARILVPVRQALRSSRSMLNFVLSQQ